jgi:CheY-like chemotaxis protein
MLELDEIAATARTGEDAAKAWADGERAQQVTCARAVRTLGRQLRSLESSVGAGAAPGTTADAAPGTTADAATGTTTDAEPDARDALATVTPILLIDDSALVAEQLAEGLHAVGVGATTALEPESAVAAVRAHAPRIIVTDVNMPGVDLADLVSRCRRASRSRVLVLLLSGMEADDLAAIAREVDADGYLNKQRGTARIVDRLALILQESTP